MRLPRQRPRQNPDCVVIVIDDRRPSSVHDLEEGALFLPDRLERSEPLQMGGTDVSDQADVRCGDGGEPGDLSRAVRSHLDDDKLMLFPHLEQGLGKTDQVIQVSLRREDRFAIGRRSRRASPWSSSSRNSP